MNERLIAGRLEGAAQMIKRAGLRHVNEDGLLGILEEARDSLSNQGTQGEKQ